MRRLQLWFKMVWKLRVCYMSLFVHLFDVLTDILVIVEWWRLEHIEGDKDHVDTRLMAICAIVVLAVHKVVSTVAFFVKDQSYRRALLQFLDLVIFEEIWVTHRRVVEEFQSHKSQLQDDAVETTTSFKYVRFL